MKTSGSIAKISLALLKAQKEIGGAKKGSTNPFFHSSYADLGAVMEACKDQLNENEITVLQPVGCDEMGVYVETVLLHSSGEYISAEMRIASKSNNNPQDQGSAITYARRYSLQSMVFIPAEDDDAEKAVRPMGNTPDALAKAKEHEKVLEHIRMSKDIETLERCKPHLTIASRPLYMAKEKELKGE